MQLDLLSKGKGKNCGWCYWYIYGAKECCAGKCKYLVDWNMLWTASPEDYKAREEAGLIKEQELYEAGNNKHQQKLKPEFELCELRCEI